MTKMIICKSCGEVKEHSARGLCTKCYNKKVAYESALMSKYGITSEQYDEILENQGGVCYGCGRIEEDSGRRLSVDHCHASGKIRGILCHRCNLILGYVRDDPEILDRLAGYLREEGPYIEEIFIPDDITICGRETSPTTNPEIYDLVDEETGEDTLLVQAAAYKNWVVEEVSRRDNWGLCEN